MSQTRHTAADSPYFPIRALAAGEPVKRVALAAGYRSAFVAAFHAAFGQTSGRYFAGSA
jgi:AraC-like DNA-binding protein